MHLTDTAIKKIKEIAESEGITPLVIRVKLNGGGCSGFLHDLYFDDRISETDEIEEFGDIKLISDPISYQYVDNVTIDYIETNMSSGFKFTSPDIKTTCGCGSSVAY